MKISSKRIIYLPHVDGLRAIAVLSVVLYHLNAKWLPGGFSGVDIFFVISGFIVSASVGSLDRVGLLRFIALFYARRLQRIAPALIACLLVTGLATATLIPPAWLSMTHQKTGIYAFFGLSNFILAKTNNDYFSPIAEFNPYTHTWSLGVEEQFYFIFPLLFFAWTFRSKWRHLTVSLFVISLLVSIGYSAWLGQTDKTSAFYMITSRFWQLAAGVLLFQFMTLGGRRFDTADQFTTPRWFSGGALFSLLLIGYGFAVSTPETFPFPGSVPSVLGALGILGFLHNTSRQTTLMRFLASHPVLFVGKISYSLYLWHWPVFVLFRWTVGIEALIHQAAALAIAFALSIASYYWVEMPFRHLPALKQLPRYAVVSIGLAFVGSSAWLANWINAKQTKFSISTVTRNANDWYPGKANIDPAYPGCTMEVTATSLVAGQFTTYSRQNCKHPVNGPRVLAIGDSHAIGYASMYKGYSMATGATVIVYNNGGCPFLSFQPWREDTDTCRTNSKVALQDMLAKIAPGDVVFLPSLRLPRFADQFVRYPDEQVHEAIFSDWAVDARAKAIVVAKDILHQFRAKGAQVIFEAPKPIFRSPIFRCAETYNRTNPSCSDGTEIDRSEMEQLRKPILGALMYLSASISDINIWDPFPILCPPGANCSAFSKSRPLFFDADHVSGYGNRLLLTSFQACVSGTCRDASNALRNSWTISSPAVTAYIQKIYTLYIGSLGRPPGPAGLRHYKKIMDQSDGNYLIVADEVWKSTEAQALYKQASLEEVVNTVFHNLFGRNALPAGIDYWVAQVRSGSISISELPRSIASNAGPADKKVLGAKLRAAKSLMEAIDMGRAAAAYAANIDFGRQYLNCITDGRAVDLTVSMINAAITRLVAGQNYTCP